MKQTGLLPFKNWKIYFFLNNLHTFYFLSCRVPLPRICSTILNSSENGHSCLISNIRGENIQFFTTKHDVSYRLSSYGSSLLFLVFLVFVYLASICHRANYINYFFLFSVFLMIWHFGALTDLRIH